MDTITITVAENDPDVIVSATLNEDAVTITLNEAATGATGPGVASGGSANDILKKTSSTNYVTAWETPTSAATASAIVRRNASGGAAFNGVDAAEVVCSGQILTNATDASIFTSGEASPIYTTGLDSSISTSGLNSPIFTQQSDSDIYTFHPSASVRSYSFKAFNATAGAALRNSAGTAVLTWGVSGQNLTVTAGTGVTLNATSYTFGTGAAAAMKTSLAIASSDITDATSSATASTIVRRDASGGAAFSALTGTGNWSTTGHFFSNPSTAEAGHFLTKNGTTPTIAAGRSAWFSSSTGDPQFRNGTSSAITLLYSGGALGTPSSGTLTSCTGLPVSTGISGLGTNVAEFLISPSAGNFQNMMPDYTGTGNLVMAYGPVITNLNLDTAAFFNATTYTYGTGAASAHRTALGLTALATTTPGTNVATALAINVGTAGAFVVNGGALGTPSSGTLTSCTGLPVSTGISGLGTGVATFLATPSSANLLAALTTSTGTGNAVFATSPTITTPTISDSTFNGTATFNSTSYVYTSTTRIAHLAGLGVTRTVLDADQTIGASPASAVVFTVPVVAGVGYILKLQARVTGTSGSIHNGQCYGTFNMDYANVMYRRPGYESELFVQTSTPFTGLGFFNTTNTSIQTGIAEGIFYPLTSGNFIFAISNTGTGTVTLKKGSYIELQKIN